MCLLANSIALLTQAIRCANPSYTADELAYQFRITKVTVVITHPASVQTALGAARQCGIAADHIVLIDRLQTGGPIPYATVPELVEEGLALPVSFTERRLSPGEAKTKLALLSCSSGTTGRPKVRIVSVHGCRSG